MKVAIIHGEVAADAARDEIDVLTQVDFVSRGLTAIGHEPIAVPVSLNLAEAARTITALGPAIGFNLVETISGRGSLIHIVPALLDTLQLPYTGAGTEAMILTSNKLLAKKWLGANSLPTPPWFTASGIDGNFRIEGSWLVKSVWEHASIGLDEESVIPEANREELLAEMDNRRCSLGGACFAEAFIDGRELNLSLLAGENGPEVLPPAEIRFDAYPPGKIRVVGYRSKWAEGSFEFDNTPRSFDFPATDASLLAHLKQLALQCWRSFNLHGYARVDFRVDREGRPWILEVNANPCLSPDAGFSAATLRAGLSFPDVLRRIISDIPPASGQGSAWSVRPASCSGETFRMPDGDRFAYRENVTPADREAVGRLVRATGFFSEEEAGIAEELVDERLAKGEASGYLFLFAEEGGRLLGYTCFGPIPGSVHSYDLYWIAVDPDERGKGLGKKLMAESERIMAGRGGKRVYADTSSRPQYEPTRSFYHSCGYLQATVLADFYAPADGKTIFVKTLPAK
jgi:D-alanine-D-alanine ligase